MRISSGVARAVTGAMLATLVGGVCIGFGLGSGPDDSVVRRGLTIAPALAFDGTATPNTAVLTPGDGLRGARTPQEIAKAKELTALQYAADQGELAAQWKLGQMYADGDGVPQDDFQAFNYFSELANSHPEAPPGTPEARVVAKAFVALGRYYLKGIPNTRVRPDTARARQMFNYAASYFGDADAQYELGRLYLDGTPRDPHEAARWLQLAATKGQCRAEATLGELLFRGQYMPRQAARGLMWLMLGKDCAGPEGAWVKPLYDDAIRHASDDEQAMALVYLSDWLRGRRD